MVKVAVILSGCGYLDGAEIRESVLTLLALDKREVDVDIFAPDIKQHHVVDHMHAEEVSGESRNVLAEAARIARGDIVPLSELTAEGYDALVVPGGFGVAKNLSTVAFKGAEGEVLAEFSSIIEQFFTAEKPIVAICIAPAAIAAALQGKTETPLLLTLGEADQAELIEGFGATYQTCPTRGIVIDDRHKVITTPAYMRDDANIRDVASGIEQAIEALVHHLKSNG